MSKHAFVGIDMGATHTRLCILDERRNIIKLEKYLTNDIVEKNITLGIKSLIQDPIDDIELLIHRIVIGLPATISKDRQKVLSTPNLTVPIDDFNALVPQLKKEFNCPVELERDVNLQVAYDTDYLNIADQTVLGCYLGSGFGFSIWLNGDVYTGAHGVAGELGHIALGDDNLQCGCGNKGCLETIVSGVRLKAEYDQQNANYDIADFFAQETNKDFIDNYIIRAAKAIASSINLFDPDIVILGGGVIDMKNFPFGFLKKKTLEYTRFPLPREALVFMQASSSSFNGASGAAIQALNRTK